MHIWVVVERDGPVLKEIHAFRSEEDMNEAGYFAQDENDLAWPHNQTWIDRVWLE